MKISEITLEMIKDYINAPEEKDKTVQLLLDSSKHFIKNRTGISDDEKLDKYEDLTLALLCLCSDMYDRRQFMLDSKSRFEIQELKKSIDDDNIPTESWTTIWTTKGRIRKNTSYNKDVENGDRSSITKTITARFPKHLNNFDVEDTNKYKVLYNNKLYKIASMSNIREENKYIQINIGGWE